MTGQKKRSGGARKGAGRLQVRLRLSEASAQELAIIVGHNKALDPTMTPEKMIEQWIHDEWCKLDALYQENAEHAV